jgi:hypothetical protein
MIRPNAENQLGEVYSRNGQWDQGRRLALEDRSSRPMRIIDAHGNA